MTGYLLPLFLVLLASVFQGTFGLGMKFFKPLPWEAWWLVHATVAMLLIPFVWAYIAVPNLRDAIGSAPSGAVFSSMLFGFLWGIGGIMFGVSVRYVGVSLTYGIVMGLAALMGAVVPLLRIPEVTSSPSFVPVVFGIAIMPIGVAFVAFAGIRRDRIHAAAGREVSGMQQGAAFRKGLAVAITSGLLSSFINIGFANAQPVAEVAQAAGALTRNASLAAWVVVLAGAYLMNFLYSAVLLTKHGTWGSFGTAGAGKALRWAVIAGILWFGALGVYGQGSALMGGLGPIIGWPMLLGLSLVVSNFIAYKVGEWKGASGALRIMITGLAVIILACCVLGYSNSFGRAVSEPDAITVVE